MPFRAPCLSAALVCILLASPRLAASGCDLGFLAPRSFAAGPNPQWIAAGDFNADGKPDLVVVNSEPDGSASVLLADVHGDFHSGGSFQAGPYPATVVVADLNGDKKLDLVVGNSAGTNVFVLLGNGDGTFQAGQPLDAGLNPWRITVGDFDGDGHPDLGLAISTGVAVLLAKGGGAFADAAIWPTPSTPQAIVTGDFNGDGIQDLATANGGSGPNHTDGSVSILLGKGNGRFAQPQNSTALDYPCSLALGDFDQDGHLDLAVLTYNWDFPGSLIVLWGRGDGSFETGSKVRAPTNARFVAAADLNGDGRLDLAVAGDELALFYASTNRIFRPDQTLAFGGAGVGLLAGDLDGDQNNDLVVVSANSGRVAVWLTRSLGPPAFALNYAAGIYASSVATGDFDGDGRADLAVTSLSDPTNPKSLQIFLGNGDGTFRPGAQSKTGLGAASVAAADLNGDGRTDLVVANSGTILNQFYNDGSLSVLLGKGDGTFQAPSNYAVGKCPIFVLVGDLNGDGRPDLVAANLQSGTISVLSGQGEGNFAGATDYDCGLVPIALAAGDFNRDGRTDLAVANSLLSGTVSVLLGNQKGGFEPRVAYVVGVYPRFLISADLNHDGNPDLIVADRWIQGGGTVRVLIGNGNGTFAQPRVFPVGELPMALAAADLNGDGQLDLLAANFTSSDISVLRGNGDGTFLPAVSYTAGPNPGAILAWDVDGSGTCDVGVANRTLNGSVTILLNTCWPNIRLSFEKAEDGIGLRWPLAAAGSVLESTVDLSRSNWQPVLQNLTPSNGQWTLAAGKQGPQRYFRLRRLQTP